MAEKIKTGHIVGGLIGIGTLGGIIYALTRPVEAVPPEEAVPPTEAGAIIHIEIIDASPIKEGETYTVRVTVTNTSTRAGIPWEATLIVGILAEISLAEPPWYHVLIPYTESSELFAAGQTRTFDYTMTIPWDTGGLTGIIEARVLAPARVELARAGHPFTIEAVPIIYGATIAIGV